MIPIERLTTDDPTDELSLVALARKATDFIMRDPRCVRVEHGYLDIGWEGILAVFWFEVQSLEAQGDIQTTWVIVGDIPSALISNSNPNGPSALDAYAFEMERWVNAARVGKPVNELIPVNVPATKEWAEKLGKRLSFIRTELLSEYEDQISDRQLE